MISPAPVVFDKLPILSFSSPEDVSVFEDPQDLNLFRLQINRQMSGSISFFDEKGIKALVED